MVIYMKRHLGTLRIGQHGQDIVFDLVCAHGVQVVRVALGKIILVNGRLAGLRKHCIHAGVIPPHQGVQERAQCSVRIGHVGYIHRGGWKGRRRRATCDAGSASAEKGEHEQQVQQAYWFHLFTFLVSRPARRVIPQR